ncbi:MAG: phage antirepressor protein [Phascolarctobacterium sp.]|nr:phage antirepressor protein [Phascolarctobacterium sp.]
MQDIKEFQSNQIRSVWSDETGEWYFSVVDVIGALTDSVNPTDYLKKMRKRDAILGSYIGTNCPQVAMMTDSGKHRKTLAANTEQLLRIIQSIPSPKAEPFKLWMAQLGADHIHDIEAAEALGKEIDQRLAARDDVRQHNIALADAAFAAGVKTSLDFARFQNSGYMGLYNGETAGDIKRRKGLKKNQEILDHMNSEELGANLFRITQAEAKLRREKVQTKEEANKIHFEVGHVVRKTIESLGGTMPEELPTPKESIKSLDPNRKREESK